MDKSHYFSEKFYDCLYMMTQISKDPDMVDTVIQSNVFSDFQTLLRMCLEDTPS